MLTVDQERFHRVAARVRRTHAVADLRKAVAIGLGLLSTESKPTVAEAIDAIEGNCGVREWKQGRVRWLRNPRKNASEAARALRDACRWHDGSGSLYSMHAARMMFGGKAGALADRMDRLSGLLRAIGRGDARSRACAAWKRTGVLR